MGRRLGYVLLVVSACVFLAAGPAAALMNPVAHRFSKSEAKVWAQKRTAPSTTSTTSAPRRSGRGLVARALVLSDLPDLVVTDLPYRFTLRAVTRDGSTATGYRGTVVFMSTDKAAEVLDSPYTFVPKDAGEHVFTVTFKTPGRHWLHVNDTVNLSLSTEQGGIVVTDDPAALVRAAVSAAARAESIAASVNAAAAQASAASTTTSSSTSSTSTTLSNGSTTSTTSSGGSTTSSSSSTSSTSTTIGSGSTTSSTSLSSSTTSTTSAGSNGGGGSSGSSNSSSSTSTTVPVRREAAEVSNPSPAQGQTVKVTGDKETFTPDQELKVELRSDPIVLVPTRSAADGSYVADVTIPDIATPGDHEIVVSGLAFDGTGPLESFVTVNVVASGSSSSTGATGASESSSSSATGGAAGATESSGGGSSTAGSGSSDGGGALGQTGWSPGLMKLAFAFALVGIVLVRTGKPEVVPANGRVRF